MEIKDTRETVEREWKYTTADMLLDAYNLGQLTLPQVIDLYHEQYNVPQ